MSPSMSYVQSTLAPNEGVLAVARFHWSYTLVAMLYLVAGVAATAWLWGQDVSGMPSGTGWALLAPLAIAVTNHRIVCKQGFVARRTSELPLNWVEEINVRQSVVGRILGFGKVLVSGTGGDTPMNIPTIDDPVAFRTAIPMAKGHGGD